MNQAGSTNQSPPKGPPTVGGEPNAFLVQRWMFWAGAALVTTTITCTLLFVGLATKEDLKQLTRREDLKVERIASYARCVSENFAKMEEFSSKVGRLGREPNPRRYLDLCRVRWHARPRC